MAFQRRLTTAVLILALGVGKPGSALHGQSASPDQGACTPMPSDRHTVEPLWIAAVLINQDVGEETMGASPLFLTRFLRELQSFVAPPTDSSTLLPQRMLEFEDFRAPSDSSLAGWSILDLRVHFSVHVSRNGTRTVTAAPENGPRAPGLDSSLRTASRQWLASPLALQLLDDQGVDSLSIGVHVALSESLLSLSKPDTVVVRWIDLPVALHSFSPVKLGTRGKVRRSFARRHPGLVGRVLTEFLVRTDGTPDLSTLRPVGTNTTPRFLRAARETLSTERFRPAMLGGCAIPMRVQQGFNFSTPPAEIPDATRRPYRPREGAGS